MKVFDDYLKYMLVVPLGAYDGQVCSQFVFLINTPFGDDTAITPDQASIYLMHKTNPEIKVVNVKDKDGNDTVYVTNRITGQKAQISFPKELTDPKTWENT